YRNCSSADQADEFNFSKKESVGQKVVKTQVLAMGAEASAKLSYNGAEGGVKFSRTITITDAEEKSFQEDQTVGYRGPVKIPSMKLLEYTRVWIRRNATIPFVGTAEVDGPVAGNAEGIAAVSQVLSNPADRTFKFSGFVTDVDVFSGSVDF